MLADRLVRPGDLASRRGAVPAWPWGAIERHLTISRRATRLSQVFVAGLILAWLVFAVAVTVQQSFAPGRWVNTDYGVYVEATRRLLAGGSVFTQAQLAGPHVTVAGEAMYPPLAFVLFVPFTLVPPLTPLWWVIPLTAYGLVLISWRPRGWPLVAILACLATPQTIDIVWLGNPGLWVAGFGALGTRYPLFGPLVFLKPSVFPFGFIGIRSPAWWVGAAAVGAATIALLPATLDWVRVVLNARGPFSGPLYGLNNVPLLAAVVIARNAASPSHPRRWMRPRWLSARARAWNDGAPVGSDVRPSARGST